jgi:hypothetical protein
MPRRGDTTRAIAPLAGGPSWWEPDEFARALVYRCAYGLAARRLERDRIGPNAPGPALGLLLDRLTAWVVREMGDHWAREAIAEGVADAVEGRRPRW